MAKKGILDDGSGPEEVRVTIVVEPGRVRTRLTKVLAGARVRAGGASVGVIAAVVAVAIIVASSSAVREHRSAGTHSLWPRDPDAVVTRFGIQLNCPRVSLVSLDGAYARFDFEPDGGCGKVVTLILHRIHGVWVREFEASGWTCPMSQLPQPAVTDLGLCDRTVVPSRPVAPPPRGVL